MIILIAVFITFRYSGLQQFLSLENLLDNKDQLLASVQQNYWLVLLAYLVLFSLAVALSIPSYLVFTLAAGFLFDTFWGTLYSLLAALVGSLLVFYYAGHFARQRLRSKYRIKVNQFNRELKQFGPKYLVIMRFLSFFPFWLFNLLAGLLDIPTRAYAWTTLLGLLPATFIYVFMGSEIAEAQTTEEIFSWEILAAFFLLKICVLVISLWYRKQSPTERP
jgi:uncharacterized membrane protein YdjX (TVP38/TMEM64 family)